jgi:hypothetical protein
MDWETVLKFVTASVASIGAGGAIIFAMSNWLGKVWANRILSTERHKLESELEKTKRELDIIKETTLRYQNEKIITYRTMVDVVARILSAFDSRQMSKLQPQETVSRFDEFNEQRMRVYGYLAMLSPQSVMDAQDQLMDHLIKISHGTVDYEWYKVRQLAINLLNEIRKDIGIDKSPISYQGEM